VIAECFEDFAQSFRIYGEAVWSLQRLLPIDRPEACSNLDAGFTAILNTYHSLYDAIRTDERFDDLGWYSEAELCSPLVLRNARHHNLANRIRGLFAYHARKQRDPTDSHRYVLLDFRPAEDGAQCIEYWVSWSDIDEMLSLPRESSRLRPTTRKLVHEYIGAARIADYTEAHAVENADVFINAVPLALNAARRLTPVIREHVDPSISMESEFFRQHFSTLEPFDLHDHVVDAIDFQLPE